MNMLSWGYVLALAPALSVSPAVVSALALTPALAVVFFFLLVLLLEVLRSLLFWCWHWSPTSVQYETAWTCFKKTSNCKNHWPRWKRSLGTGRWGPNAIDLSHASDLPGLSSSKSWSAGLQTTRRSNRYRGFCESNHVLQVVLLLELVPAHATARIVGKSGGGSGDGFASFAITTTEASASSWWPGSSSISDFPCRRHIPPHHRPHQHWQKNQQPPQQQQKNPATSTDTACSTVLSSPLLFKSSYSSGWSPFPSSCQEVLPCMLLHLHIVHHDDDSACIRDFSRSCSFVRFCLSLFVCALSVFVLYICQSIGVCLSAVYKFSIFFLIELSLYACVCLSFYLTLSLICSFLFGREYLLLIAFARFSLTISLCLRICYFGCPLFWLSVLKYAIEFLMYVLIFHLFLFLMMFIDSLL